MVAEAAAYGAAQAAPAAHSQAPVPRRLPAPVPASVPASPRHGSGGYDRQQRQRPDARPALMVRHGRP